MGSRCTSLPHLQEYKVLEDGLIDALRQMAVHDLALASLFIEGYLKNDLHPDDRRALERIKTDPILTAPTLVKRRDLSREEK